MRARKGHCPGWRGNARPWQNSSRSSSSAQVPSQLGGRPARGHCGVPLLHHVLFRRQEATTLKGLLLQPWDPGDESLSGDMEVPERQAFSRGCFVLVALSVHSEGASGEQGASCPV